MPALTRQPSSVHPAGRRSRPRRAFTVVELLVVIVVIILLVTILIVGLSGALTAGKRAKAQSQVQTISQAVEAFKKDFNYVPPLIYRDGNSWTTPELEAAQAANAAAAGQAMQDAYDECRYFSDYSISVYLMGVGQLNPAVGGNDWGQLPAGSAQHDGVAGPGIRTPGQFRAWRDPNDPSQHQVNAVSRVYGPYLDFGSMTDIVDIDPPSGAAPKLYRVLDPWGNPVRYYANWPVSEVDVNGRRNPSVARIPVPIRDPAAVRAQLAGASASEVAQLDATIRGVNYALLSAGGDASGTVASNPLKGGAVGPIAPFGDVVLDSGNDNDGKEIRNSADIAGLSVYEQDQLLKALESNVRYPR